MDLRQDTLDRDVAVRIAEWAARTGRAALARATLAAHPGVWDDEASCARALDVADRIGALDVPRATFDQHRSWTSLRLCGRLAARGDVAGALDLAARRTRFNERLTATSYVFEALDAAELLAWAPRIEATLARLDGPGWAQGEQRWSQSTWAAYARRLAATPGGETRAREIVTRRCADSGTWPGALGDLAVDVAPVLSSLGERDAARDLTVRAVEALERDEEDVDGFLDWLMIDLVQVCHTLGEPALARRVPRPAKRTAEARVRSVLREADDRALPERVRAVHDPRMRAHVAIRVAVRLATNGSWEPALALYDSVRDLDLYVRRDVLAALAAGAPDPSTGARLWALAGELTEPARYSVDVPQLKAALAGARTRGGDRRTAVEDARAEQGSARIAALVAVAEHDADDVARALASEAQELARAFRTENGLERDLVAAAVRVATAICAG